jgi:hypothetical protein
MVKSWNSAALVVANAGNYPEDINVINDDVDILSVEGDIGAQMSASGISPLRWLGVQEGVSSEGDAETRLQTFRGNGGFWYYGTTNYTVLPGNNWAEQLTSYADNLGRPDCCLQEGPHNLLANPGFDSAEAGVSGWTLENGAQASWQQSNVKDANGIDADGLSCRTSGSAHVSVSSDTQRMSQCVTVQPSHTYNFGAHIHTAGGGYAHCGVDLFSGSGCSGSPSNVADSLWLNVAWSPDLASQINTASNTASAKVSCYGEDSIPFFFDLIYLSPAPYEY